MFKLRLFLSLSFLLAVVGGCGTRTATQTEISEQTQQAPVLVVGIDTESAGNFVVGGEIYGYPYEVLSLYAASQGKELELITGKSLRSLRRELGTREADVLVTLQANIREEEKEASEHLFSTKYVMLSLTSSDADLKHLSALTRQKSICCSSGFQHTASYDVLLDSLQSAQMCVMYLSGYELAQMLSEGKCDLVICEKSEASVAMAFMRNIREVYSFDEPTQVSVLFRDKGGAQRDTFMEWYAGQYLTSSHCQVLTNIYFGKGFASQLRTIHKPNRVLGGISIWDDLIQSVGERENVDWRLLSAIAYNESRFNPNAVSCQGAKGLMQIMPIVADQFNIRREEIDNPEINITLAAKLIKSIERILGFETGSSDEDRLKITLAAYNGGIGNVRNAQILARSNGDDPNSWEVVSHYLRRMADRNYIAGSPISKTFYGSGETIAFVGNVIDKYETYRKALE